MKVQRFLEMAVDHFIDADPPAPEQPPPMSKKEKQAHENLSVIFDRGTANEVEWICGNLITFVGLIAAREAQHGATQRSRKTG
jgi:hypothetical protein